MGRSVRTMGWVVTATLLAACTGQSASPADPTATGAGSTATSLPTTTQVETPRPSEGPDEIWRAFHDERLGQLGVADEPDPTAFESLATEQGVEAAVDLVTVGRSEIASDMSDHAAWPAIELASDGQTATVEDCIVVATADADAAARTQAWTGELVLTEDGWRVDAAAPGADGCVPAELSGNALAAYRSWLDGLDAWWDPADPEHPQLEATMTGDGLDDMRQTLTQHRDDGIVVRDSHDPVNAVVFEVGIDEVTVSDCWPAAVGNELAAFDAETGERLEELSPAPDGDRTDRLQVDLVREGDRWLVAGWLSRTGAECTPGGTPYVVVP